LPKVNCSDNILNQDETRTDCGGVCANLCSMLALRTSAPAQSFLGYNFSLEDSVLKGDHLEYSLRILTPGGIAEERVVQTGTVGWMDTVKFVVENGTDVSVNMTVMLDHDLTGLAPKGSTVMTLGGLSCYQKRGGVCTRTFEGYNITMINRISEEKAVRMLITFPSGLSAEGIAYEGGKNYMTVGSTGIIIGVIDYMVPGGYSAIWAKKR
ncbi:MAG: hypothetical protein PHG85_05340, partial [Candidatus Altiarchaeota archaeon]|nr:hypothetical protein [Candidatus Altiarchaeota archaeon]